MRLDAVSIGLKNVCIVFLPTVLSYKTWIIDDAHFRFLRVLMSLCYELTT